MSGSIDPASASRTIDNLKCTLRISESHQSRVTPRDNSHTQTAGGDEKRTTRVIFKRHSLPRSLASESTRAVDGRRRVRRSLDERLVQAWRLYLTGSIAVCPTRSLPRSRRSSARVSRTISRRHARVYSGDDALGLVLDTDVLQGSIRARARVRRSWAMDFGTTLSTRP